MSRSSLSRQKRPIAPPKNLIGESQCSPRMRIIRRASSGHSHSSLGSANSFLRQQQREIEGLNVGRKPSKKMNRGTKYTHVQPKYHEIKPKSNIKEMHLSSVEEQDAFECKRQTPTDIPITQKIKRQKNGLRFFFGRNYKFTSMFQGVMFEDTFITAITRKNFLRDTAEKRKTERIELREKRLKDSHKRMMKEIAMLKRAQRAAERRSKSGLTVEEQMQKQRLRVKQNEAATGLQTLFRGKIVRSKYKKTRAAVRKKNKKAIVGFQSNIRGKRVRKDIEWNTKYTLKGEKKKLRNIDVNVTKIVVHKTTKTEKQISRLQAVQRGKVKRKELVQQKVSARKIQFFLRRRQAKMQVEKAKQLSMNKKRKKRVNKRSSVSGNK
eukprot:maker-scaffold_5-snap-gene-8.4-mRNA-1 protein AED:0.28 eAED:0.28 QI:0/0.5/0.42/0.71/0.83/0.85/7/54/379